MDEFRAYLSSFSQLDVTPFLLALAFGGAIGLERELSGRPAGLRTHILVCLSSTMLISVSRSVAESHIEMGEIGRIVFDPNRMGAGIVTGIGFLGAATVLRSGDLLRGLTTAACIWFVAGLGVVLGTGHYAIATFATLLVAFVLTALNSLAACIRPVIYRRIQVTARDRDISDLVTELRGILDETDMRILDVSSSRDPIENKTKLDFHLALRNKFQAQLIERAAQLDGVMRARWRLIN